MGIMKMGGMTLKSLFKKAPTRRYPYEMREPFARTRGQVAMTNFEECIFCGMCQKACPCDAIAVDRAESTWEYWPFKCIACDSCVRKCPKNIIEMVKERPAIATSLDNSSRFELTAEQKAEKERIAAEKKAKILEAKKRKDEEARLKEVVEASRAREAGEAKD